MSSGFTAEIVFGSRLITAIAAAIVHHHQGKITVVSVPDQGSQFIVQLPTSLLRGHIVELNSSF